MRLIDADALRYEIDLCDIETFADRLTIIEQINNAPTIEAEPVRHGRWETDREDVEWNNSLKRKHCTNCGKRPHLDRETRKFILTPYCPNCGAKMRGGANE